MHVVAAGSSTRARRSLLARLAFGGDTTRTAGGSALALIPVGVALVLGSLLFPRSVPPLDVPLPVVDGRVVDREIARDRARAASARATPLPPDVRALGSALRAFHTLQARNEESSVALHDAKREVDRLVDVAMKSGGLEPLAALRAVQLETFLAEVRAFEASGEESPELAATGGAFVRRMRGASWIRGHKLAMHEPELRVAYKLVWNEETSLDRTPELQPTLDEQRVLYSFYLRTPHASDASLFALAAARRAAKDRAACEALEAGERVAAEAWRLDKARRLGALDPTYPTAFATGVIQYRRGSYTASVEAFRAWLAEHPEGPYALRARNHLKAALEAADLAP